MAGGGGGGGWGCLLFMISGLGPPAAGSILAAPHPRLNSRTVAGQQFSRDFLKKKKKKRALPGGHIKCGGKG